MLRCCFDPATTVRMKVARFEEALPLALNEQLSAAENGGWGRATTALTCPSVLMRAELNTTPPPAQPTPPAHPLSPTRSPPRACARMQSRCRFLSQISSCVTESGIWAREGGGTGERTRTRAGARTGGGGECANGVAHAGTRAGRDRDSTTTLAHSIEIIVSADRAFDGIPGLTRVAPPPGLRTRHYRPTARTVSPARSVQHGQSSRVSPAGMCRTRQPRRSPRDRGSRPGSRARIR